MYDKLIWRSDRMLLGDLVFRLEHYRRDDWELGNQCFVFYKTKALVDQYAQFWRTRPDFAPQNVVELGVWDGGSLAFWFEAFHPAKLVGVDVQQKETSPYLQGYISRQDLGNRLKIYWGTDQSDSAALRRIAANEFKTPLDLVIDDASHMYELTKASFETLLPLVRPGGLYIIEDWAWGHWQEFRTPDHPWFHEKPLTELVRQLIAATGSWEAGAGTSQPLIASVHVFQGFAVVERGGLALDPSRSLALADHTRPEKTTSAQPHDDRQTVSQALAGLSGREIADAIPLRKILQALAFKAANRRGFGWLYRFKRLGKRLLVD